MRKSLERQHRWQSPQHCDYFRWLLPSWVTSLVDETARTLGRYDDHSLLQFQSFLGRFFSRILVRARFNLHFIPALPVCEIKKMEIESLGCPPCLCPEIVLSIENLNEKWGQRRYRFKISNFYSYCMTILIHFLQPSSCKPIVMEKSPHSSSLLLSMAFSRSDLQKQTWFQLTDRRQAPVSCQTSSRVSYKAGYELRAPDIPQSRSAMKERRELVGGLGGGHLVVFSYGKITTFLGYQQSSLHRLLWRVKWSVMASYADIHHVLVKFLLITFNFQPSYFPRDFSCLHHTSIHLSRLFEHTFTFFKTPATIALTLLNWSEAFPFVC